LFYSGQLQWVVKEKVTAYGQNLIVGQGEGCISWVDISFDYSSIMFCVEGNIELKHNVPWYFHQGNVSSNHFVIDVLRL
jgi:hypothetical protein